MDVYFRGPTTVAVVSPRVAFRRAIAAAIEAHAFPSPVTDERVLAAESVETDAGIDAAAFETGADALDALEGRDEVGCVVVDDSLADPGVAAFVDRLRERRPALPVIVCPADGDEALAAAVTARSDVPYVPRPAGEGGTDPAAGATGDGDSGAGSTDASADGASGDGDADGVGASGGGDADGSEEANGGDGGDGAVDTGAYDALVARIESALSTYDRRYRNALDSDMLDAMLSDLEVALYAKDLKGRHLRMADTQGGPNPEDAIGKTDAQLYGDPEMADETESEDVEVVRTGESIRGKMEQWGAGDTAVWMRTTKVPWRDADGEPRGLVGITQDVTALQRRIRELERERDRLEEFGSFVSHDLRNPLNVASGYVELAREERDSESLERAADALERIEELLEDIEQLARGDATAERGSVQFVDVAERAWGSASAEAATLEVDVADDAVIDAGPELGPLLENLFKNSVDHGGSDVTVTVGAHADGFFVADDGPGIPEDEREDVFEEGYTTAGEGRGTGLSIVAEVGESYGWDLSVTESASGGARFEFGNCLFVPDPSVGVARRRWEAEGQRHALDRDTAIGDPSYGGSATESDGTWTVEAAGDDMYQESEEGHLVYTTVSGPVRVEARIVGVEGPHEFSKAGVVVRDAVAAGAPLEFVGNWANGRTEVLWRRTAGDPIRSQQRSRADDARRVRIERMGGTVTCWIATDDEWHPLAQRPVDLADPVTVGLALSSALFDEPATATFEGVRVWTLDE